MMSESKLKNKFFLSYYIKSRLFDVVMVGKRSFLRTVIIAQIVIKFCSPVAYGLVMEKGVNKLILVICA